MLRSHTDPRKAGMYVTNHRSASSIRNNPNLVPESINEKRPKRDLANLDDANFDQNKGSIKPLSQQLQS